MARFRYVFLSLSLCLAMSGARASLALAGTSPAVQRALNTAVNGPQRTPAFTARDRYRHPFKTLEFFGIRPDMSVVEILPGAGWYTQILAPFLHDHGNLVEALPPLDSPNAFARKMAARFKAKLKADAAVYGRIKTEPFEPPSDLNLGAAGTTDMILTFRNIHDFMYANVHGTISDVIIERFFRNAYRALKPGGVLGVVAHRAPDGMSPRRSFKLGRLPQKFVIGEAERAGFRLAGASEINANSKDPRKFPVWYLPPSLARGKTDRRFYKSIGEADNMTLRFVKPGP